MDIRILPGNIANMIAAGEVVQRPASVVKELMENSVDAGAGKVSVVILDAGRTLVQVIDDGCGLSPDDAVLCFERHATSKLATAEDLDNILTFGFRGEALASIAAISEVTLKTRREEDELGVKVEFAGSRQTSLESVSAPKGANFAVRNIFYNVPARRKYLKSDNVEFRHIVEEFTRVALTRPDVCFTLTHNDREVMALRKVQSLKFRIQGILGNSAAGDLVDISTETSLASISGYVCKPDSVKKSSGSQYFFVNGRYFRSPYLHKAVMKAYEGLVPDGYMPSYFIYLQVPSESIDVNISPTKTEIKFAEDSLIFQTIYACVKESLGKLSFSDSIDFERGGIPEMPVMSSRFDDFRPIVEPEISIDPSYNPFDNDGFSSEKDVFNKVEDTVGRPSAGSFDYGRFVSRDESYGKLFEDRTMPSKSVMMVRGRYVLTEVKSGIMVINIRRAWERILYERFMDAASKNGHVTQTALFPVTVRVGVEDRLIFDDNASLLESLGFDIRPFGEDTVVVGGVPEGFSLQAGKVERMVFDMLAIFKDESRSVEEDMTSRVAEKFALMGAMEGQNVSSPIEAQRLIDMLFACRDSEFTASGNRTVGMIPAEDIERLF